jgi:ABC-2 type transport system permease protein
MLAFPVLIVVAFAVPIGLAFVNPEKQKTIGLVDATGRLLKPVSAKLARETLADGRPEYVVEPIPIEGTPEETRRASERRILDGELYGIVTAGNDLDAAGNYRFYRRNVGDERTARTVAAALQDAVVDLRLERTALDLKKELLEELMAPIDLQSFQVTAGEEAKKKGFLESYFVTYLFVMMLYFMLYFYGYAVTRGVLQEKTSRVMEVLLGSVSPDQLMTGKIIGIGLVGLTQMGFYLIALGAVRIAALVWLAGVRTGFDTAAILDAIAPSKLIFFVVYFVLGYFLFVSLFAIVGAVCNSEQEAQQLQIPVMMSLMIPMLSTIFFVQHPDSTAAVVLSLIPLFTPMLMFMRISVLSPPAWQIALSLVLMAGAIYLLFRGAAKVFRVGTLMYGKRPSIAEIWRWSRS